MPISSQSLELIASQLCTLAIPELVQWGHSLMMAILFFVMSSFVVFSGWHRRLERDAAVASQSRIDHHKIAHWMLFFITVGYVGYIGGVVSLAYKIRQF